MFKHVFNEILCIFQTEEISDGKETSDTAAGRWHLKVVAYSVHTVLNMLALYFSAIEINRHIFSILYQ